MTPPQPTITEKKPDQEEEEPWATLGVNTQETLELKIRRPTPYPCDPALSDIMYEHAERGRIPPWEFTHSLRQVMRSINHNGEEFLVLDELDAEENVNEL